MAFEQKWHKGVFKTRKPHSSYRLSLSPTPNPNTNTNPNITTTLNHKTT